MSETFDRVRAQFARTAANYVTSPDHAVGDDLERMIALAGDLSGRRVLDVATGGGHTALAFARGGADVVASDLTPEMLAAAAAFVRSELGEDGAVAFEVAPAEALPFGDGTFDVVTCRIAAHHFADPRAFVREAARVLAPGGTLMLVDNVAPEDPALAVAMNAVERRRDPSHVEAYPVSRWIAWLAAAGFEPLHLSRGFKRKDYRRWLERAATPPEIGEALAREVLALSPAARRYLRVEADGGRLLTLAHEAALLVARRSDRGADGGYGMFSENT